MEKGKNRKHPICEKAPIVAMILSTVILFIPKILFGFLGSVFNIVVAIISLLLIGLWFKPAFKGAIKTSVPINEILKMLIPFLVYVVANEVVQIASGNFYVAPTLGKLAMAFDAGASEEVIFRAAAIAIGIHYIKSEKNITMSWAISSIIFGAAHIMNATMGAAFVVAVMQVIGTVFMGIFFASLYVRTGSIVIPVLVHGIWDFIVLATDTTVSEDAIMVQSSVDISLVMAVLFNVAVAVYAIRVMNREKDKIKRIWEEKWGI